MNTKLCPRGKHNYQPIGKPTYHIEEKNTHVHQMFWCNLCCDVTEREIALWINFVPFSRCYSERKERKTKKQKPVDDPPLDLPMSGY